MKIEFERLQTHFAWPHHYYFSKCKLYLKNHWTNTRFNTINGVNTTVYLLFAWFCHLWGENCLLRFKTYTQCSLCTLLGSFDKICLRAHNYQKWKGRFFICPCHKIYWVEAVGLSLSIILLNLRFLWVGDIWGNFMKNWYFVNNHFIKVQIKKNLLHI